MRSRFKESLILLLIFLALALPGAEGVSFSGTNNCESISANVHATTASAAGVTYGRGDFHFYGDGDAKYSRKYSTGTTWSQVGVDIKDAAYYDDHIGGGKDTKARTTNAYANLLAEDAEYISVYGKSGTSKNIGTGVELTVEDGNADVLVATSADGKNLASESILETNEDGDNAIFGSEIYAKGYYTGSKGQVSAEVEDGSIEDYHIATASNIDAAFADQYAGSISGDYVNLAASTKKTASGVTRDMKQQIDVFDGHINGFTGHVDDSWDHWEDMDYYIYQDFADAGMAGLYASTAYIETSKNSKIKAEQSAYLENGMILGDEEEEISSFQSGADSEGVWQGIYHADGDYVSFEDRFTSVNKKATKKTSSTATINKGNVDKYWGAAGPSGPIGGPASGSIHYFDRAQGASIYLDNYYQDNLGQKGGFGRTSVSLGDPAAQSDNGDLTGSIEDYEGRVDIIADAKTVRSQGYTDRLNVNTNARAYYNQLAEDSYSASDWENYFIAEAKSTSPWTVSVDTGHQVRGDDTIQNAINTMPYTNGNIYLLPPEEKIYNEHDIVNNANTANGEVSFTLWGAGSYLKVWNPAPIYDTPASNSVIDADIGGDGKGDGRIFDLHSSTSDRTFTFKNIDFNNGYSTERGGAIKINQPGEGFKPTASIENSNFNNNWAEMNGGAVYTRGDLFVKNCEFTGNTAYWYGGAILNAGATATIENSNFKDNSAGDGGGAIEQVDTGAASPAMMTLNDCNFVNNHADAGSGGAIYNIYYGLSDTPSTITANGCTFDGNQALWGGAIYSEGDLGIKDSAFNNNHAEWGGAIESTWGTATIEDSDFTDNYAELGGGAVLSTDGTNEPRTMTLNECTFTNNHVNDGDGGAVMNVYTGYAATSPVIIADGCTFDGNTATGNGGAYAAINYGGAGAPGTVNIITGSDFQNNVAGGKGNAFYAQTPSTNTFIGNTYGPDQDIVIE